MGKNRFVGSSVNIAPRRKKVGDESVQRSTERIQISKEMILSLASKPLAKAAQSVGISETALKRACRELGFTKWPRATVDIQIKLEDLVAVSSSSSSSSSPTPPGCDPYKLAPNEAFSFPSLDMPSESKPLQMISPIAKGRPVHSPSIDDDLEKLKFDRSHHEVSAIHLPKCDSFHVADIAAFHPVVKSEVDNMDLAKHCFLSACLARSVKLPEVSLPY